MEDAENKNNYNLPFCFSCVLKSFTLKAEHKPKEISGLGRRGNRILEKIR
jgi:hypothetical protein